MLLILFLVILMKHELFVGPRGYYFNKMRIHNHISTGSNIGIKHRAKFAGLFLKLDMLNNV